MSPEMEKGDIVKVISSPHIDGGGRICDHMNFWREATHPLGYLSISIDAGTLVVLTESPFEVKLDHPERGKRTETHVRVMHPDHGVIRGFVDWVEPV